MNQRNLLTLASVLTILLIPAAFSGMPADLRNAEPDYMATEFVWRPSQDVPDYMATEFTWLPTRDVPDYMATEFLWLPTQQAMLAGK